MGNRGSASTAASTLLFFFFFLDFSVRLFRNSGGGRHPSRPIEASQFFLPQAAMSGECDDGLTAIGIGAPNAGRQTSKRQSLLFPKPAIIYHFF
ncbi:hypothetical protein J3E68DRAFT_415189 [Trichoderma sp. SZMC 28012]